jgi:NADH dehydrogenase
VILVAGGTGRLGSQVVAGLLAAGHDVRVLARGRRPPPPATTGAELVTGSVTDPEAVARAVVDARVVVSAVTGFPFRSPDRVDLSGAEVLVRAAEEVGAAVVLVSVAGAAPTSPMGLFRAKYAAEQMLSRSSVPGTVIRPEAFADLWIELLRSTAGRSHRPLVFGRGRNPMGWVAVRDVAALTVRAVGDSSLHGSTLTISGPERLTLTDLAELVMAEQEWPGVPRHVPTPVLRVAAKLPGRAGRQAEAALAMDVMPRVFDDARSAAADLPCTSVQALLAKRAVPRA